MGKATAAAGRTGNGPRDQEQYKMNNATINGEILLSQIYTRKLAIVLVITRFIYVSHDFVPDHKDNNEQYNKIVLSSASRYDSRVIPYRREILWTGTAPIWPAARRCMDIDRDRSCRIRKII